MDLFAYKTPVPNTAEMPHFLLFGICRFQIACRGNMSIEKSEKMLIAAVAMKATFRLMQWPGSTGFQIFCLGVHWNISTNMTEP